jgi:hypothetical protein
MYTPDWRDRVTEIAGVPQAAVGAPLPVVLASKGGLALAYLTENTPEDWDGAPIRSVSPEAEGESVASILFERPYAHFFGPPNDEAFSGHPLSTRGLHPYGAFEVANSSWIRGLARMNAVHPYHRPEQFEALRHFIFAFHDSTFECVAHGFQTSREPGPLADVLARLQQQILRTPA